MSRPPKRFIEEYLPVVKAKNEKKTRKDNQLYEIEIREVDKGRKGSKFITKVLAKIQMNGETMEMICFHL